MAGTALTEFYFSDPDDTVALPVVMEALTDEEARVYADLLTPEQAREELQRLLNETDD